MTFKEISDNIRARVANTGLFGARKDDQPESNLSNGGFSGYRPGHARGRDLFATSGMQPVTGLTGSSRKLQMTGQTGAGYAAQPTAGMPDPTAYQPMMQDSGWMQPMQAADQQMMQQTGYQQTGYQQTGYQQTGYQQTGYQPAGYQQNPYDMPPQPAYDPYAQGASYAAQPTQTNPYQWGAQTAANTAVNPPVPNNLRYMNPGFDGPDGQHYTHMERIVQLVSVTACFRIIEFMRSGESVIVNTESIASESDIQRCLDMLAGAAFTLGCTMTKITHLRRAYLIAPSAVLVMQDEALTRWAESQTEQPAYAPHEEVRRSYETERSEARAFARQTAYQQPIRRGETVNVRVGHTAQMRSMSDFGGFGN